VLLFLMLLRRRVKSQLMLIVLGVALSCSGGLCWVVDS